MTTQTANKPSTPPLISVRFLAGLGLICTGLFVMVGNTTGPVRLLGLFFLLGLGAMLLLWGILAQMSGPIIPGALLTGVSIGTLITQEVYDLSSIESAGVHVMAIAGGFLLITLITWRLTSPTLWWPLIPGVILLLGGLNLLFRSAILAGVGDFWPVAMIAVGLYLVLRERRLI